jgi:hypothetical protein
MTTASLLLHSSELIPCPQWGSVSQSVLPYSSDIACLLNGLRFPAFANHSPFPAWCSERAPNESALLVITGKSKTPPPHRPTHKRQMHACRHFRVRRTSIKKEPWTCARLGADWAALEHIAELSNKATLMFRGCIWQTDEEFIVGLGLIWQWVVKVSS